MSAAGVGVKDACLEREERLPLCRCKGRGDLTGFHSGNRGRGELQS